jgi:hypothetical protein
MGGLIGEAEQALMSKKMKNAVPYAIERFVTILPL